MTPVPPSFSKSLFLARHGETVWNVEGRMQGRAGGELTTKGLTQATALAEFARRAGIRRIFSSPLRRAHETATIVAARIGVRVDTLDGLMELDFGACGGLTEIEIDARYPALRDARKKDKWRHRWPDGESYADGYARVRALVDEGAFATDEPTLVIAHQSINRVVSRALTDAPEEDVLAMAQPSDVVLRFGSDGVVSHGRVAADGVAWAPGLYLGAAPKLN